MLIAANKDMEQSMPQIKWKEKRNLKPEIILEKLKSAATIRRGSSLLLTVV